jgi:hypothetical protein
MVRAKRQFRFNFKFNPERGSDLRVDEAADVIQASHLGQVIRVPLHQPLDADARQPLTTPHKHTHGQPSSPLNRWANSHPHAHRPTRKPANSAR